MSDKAYVTLLTRSKYLPGVLVLHDSLLAVGAKYPLVVMATSTLSAEAREVVAKRGITVRDINSLHPRPTDHEPTVRDERFADTWTKLRAFELVEYERVVLLDADMIILRNMDDLFDLSLEKHWIAAVHACACNPRKIPHYPQDWIPENCAYTAVPHPTAEPAQVGPDTPRTYGLLNSGNVVLHPSVDRMDLIIEHLSDTDTVSAYKFPDQDLLATVFKDCWMPLPWYYNALKTLRVIHKQLWEDEMIRCLHYILKDKPWDYPRGTGGEYEEVNTWWWDRYERLGQIMQESDPEGWKLVDANVGYP